ncbi:MAG: TfoX/Sxy family protein [Bacteroidales bacterium]|nr:TfoX/Sxy family protein [Bacteroidales bacterium]MCB9000084.1 TfoX/Sxy family protein [Bacteroidales bacterium]MCB9012733.1 TfoX/Sxy family protein [Bacteroidales bacterium]
MASTKEFLEFVLDQIENAGTISYKRMFGEYGIYSGNKIFALICDDKFFIKPTGEGRKFIGDPVESPPYPGAKNYFLIEEKLDDHEWLSQLIRITVKVLPEPKPKKIKK